MSGSYRLLPLPPKDYDHRDQAVVRSQVEQNFQDVDRNISDAANFDTKESSLAVRRVQFLLMGAANG